MGYGQNKAVNIKYLLSCLEWWLCMRLWLPSFIYVDDFFRVYDCFEVFAKAACLKVIIARVRRRIPTLGPLNDSFLWSY